MMLAACASLALLTPTAALRAQVGHSPEHSPYEDLTPTMEFTLLGGSFHGHRDPAGVAPRSGPMFGVRWGWRATGPLNLTAEFARIDSKRDLIDPAKSADKRDLGTITRPLYALDAGLGIALTGARTYHHLMPELKINAGGITDLRTKPDSGGVKFGTRFALMPGIGVRWVGGGRFGARLDLTDYLYSMGYPVTLYQNITGDPVLPPTVSRTQWMNNPALTFGISYLFGGR
jgi:hypothetical protein